VDGEEIGVGEVRDYVIGESVLREIWFGWLAIPSDFAALEDEPCSALVVPSSFYDTHHLHFENSSGLAALFIV
jgi:hypothetical protein